jgi:FtsP/CotA-like multicopper oxidase with cupredoxin domain
VFKLFSETSRPQCDNKNVRTLIFLLATLALTLPAPAAVRHYYIAAEDVTWDFAPSGQNLLTAEPLILPWIGHTRWPKTRYIEYTDSTFTTKKPQPEWLGILGPIIRGEVGDEFVVEFLNRSKRLRDIHPHGLRYDKNNEGSYYLPTGSGSLVAPGHRFTYHWFADQGSGPGPGQLSSIVWWYHGHVEEESDVNAGLLGPILITAKGKANPDGTPKGVDREFVTSFQIFDEMGGKNDGLFYTINGYIFGNLPGLMMQQGDKVRWYLLGMGNEKDLHSPHWHGKTVFTGTRNTDVIELLPASMVSVDMHADNPGSWMFHCHVGDHMEAGMMAIYTIYPPPNKSCPIKFTSGDFWSNTGKFALIIKNTGAKPIKSIQLMSEHFLAPQDLRRPFDSNSWSLKQDIAPGATFTEEKPAYQPNSAQAVLGWVFVPTSITYADNSKWLPKNDNECFKAFWKDKDHPEIPALPPRQDELNPD